MTLEGTNTYLVGRDPAYVVDPGPGIDSHVEAIRIAADERGGIGGILLTHSHADHSAAVPLLDAPLLWGEVGRGDEALILAAGGAGMSVPRDPNYRVGSSGDRLPATGPAAPQVGPFTVIPTPGHAVDHVALVLGDVGFCGDLVLGRGSSIVPPAAGGGSLADYMESLARVRALGPALICPGHGPWIQRPEAKLDEYVSHRLERERKLVAALEGGQRSRRALLAAAWGDVPAAMRPAAALAMQAHLEKLESEGRLPQGISG
ncbi:MAG: MBL fold metallo-hydrolase [bacterium]